MMTTKNDPPSIGDLTEGADPYACRRKTDRPRYVEMFKELVKFAQLRRDDKHRLGMAWFRKDGVPKLNILRAKQGLEPLLCDFHENALNAWLERHHPDLREVFRR